MELMPYGTLTGAIKNKTIDSWKIRKQIMEDICEACAFLHASFYLDGKPKRVLLHQDLKSPNVLLGMEGGILRAKIADFGLALIKESSSDKSKSVKHNGGTFDYMAPELFSMNAKFTKRCDLFAAGIIILEIITLIGPSILYETLYPTILEKNLPKSILYCLKSSLDYDPKRRTSFQLMYKALANDTSEFGVGDDLGIDWIPASTDPQDNESYMVKSSFGIGPSSDQED
jgi:serine/threonine protein kinase